MYLSYFDEPRDTSEGAGEGGLDLVDRVGGSGGGGALAGAGTSPVFPPLPMVSICVGPTGGGKGF